MKLKVELISSILMATMFCCDLFPQDETGPSERQGFDSVWSQRCGAIALFAACEFLGIHSSIDEMVDLTNTDENGTTMLYLKLAAQAKGLHVLPIRTDIEGLKGYLSRPATCCIALAPRNHFVLVTSYRNHKLQVFDPPGAKVESTPNSFETVWKGELLVLSTAPFIDESRKLLSYVTVVSIVLLAAGFFVLAANHLRQKGDRDDIE